MKTNAIKNTLLLAVITSINTADAAGLQKVEGFINDLQAVLEGVAVAVVTIAFIWAGYKFLFKHASLAELMPVIGGAIVIGAAAEFASFFVS